MKKTELKVNINCQKCKTDILKAVAKLEGIEEVAVNGEEGILTVVGEVDPVRLTTQVRKTGKFVEIITVGPPPEKPDPAPESPVTLPHSCPNCQLIVIGPYEHDYGRICSIL